MQAPSINAELNSRDDVHRRQLADGLLYTHRWLNANQLKTLDVARFFTILVELLLNGKSFDD